LQSLSRPRNLPREIAEDRTPRREGFQRLKSRNETFGITKHETPVSKAEDCAEGFVGRGNFNLLARENLLGISVCSRNEIWPSSGSSSWLPKVIVDCAVPAGCFCSPASPSAEDLGPWWEFENAAVFKSDARHQTFFWLKRRWISFLDRHAEFILFIGAGQFCGNESRALQFKAFDFIQAASL